MTEDAKKVADVLKENRRAQAQFWRPIVGVMIAAVLILTVAVTALWLQRGGDNNRVGDLEKQNAGAQQTIAAVAADNAANRKAITEANKRLAAAGKPTVPVPTPAATITSAPSSGPTEAQVRAIVTTAIRAYRPALTTAQVEQIARVAAPKVVRPKDGRTPTAAELQPLVAVAVTSYCGEDRCVGKQGTPGQDAPPVTDERLSALIDTSLRAYCAQRNDCVGRAGADSTVPGPTGPTGPPGPQGSQGPDTSAAECASKNGDLQELTVTTTDPLTQVKILVCVLK